MLPVWAVGPPLESILIRPGPRVPAVWCVHPQASAVTKRDAPEDAIRLFESKYWRRNS